MATWLYSLGFKKTERYRRRKTSARGAQDEGHPLKVNSSVVTVGGCPVFDARPAVSQDVTVQEECFPDAADAPTWSRYSYLVIDSDDRFVEALPVTTRMFPGHVPSTGGTHVLPNRSGVPKMSQNQSETRTERRLKQKREKKRIKEHRTTATTPH